MALSNEVSFLLFVASLTREREEFDKTEAVGPNFVILNGWFG